MFLFIQTCDDHERRKRNHGIKIDSLEIFMRQKGILLMRNTTENMRTNGPCDVLGIMKRERERKSLKP